VLGYSDTGDTPVSRTVTARFKAGGQAEMAGNHDGVVAGKTADGG